MQRPIWFDRELWRKMVNNPSPQDFHDVTEYAGFMYENLKEEAAEEVPKAIEYIEHIYHSKGKELNEETYLEHITDNSMQIREMKRRIAYLENEVDLLKAEKVWNETVT